MKAFAHFCTITKHKKLVLKECFRVGLYKQGLLHDMSKYSWTEFRVGCRYYQGTRSPNNAEREEKGYSSAWLHHKGRNKHHYEYWIDYSLEEEAGDDAGDEDGNQRAFTDALDRAELQIGEADGKYHEDPIVCDLDLTEVQVIGV